MKPDTDRVSAKGSVALVTGGGRGIGRAFARALADTGMAVAVAARTADELDRTVALLEADGGRAAAHRADVSDPTHVAALAAWPEDRLGQIDLLVNNAGMFGPVEPFAETDPAEWWRTIEVNLRGPMLCTRAFLPGMLARRRGRIVNVSSGQGNRAEPNKSAYATSKGALTRLTECLASDHPDSGVRFFALAPGPTPTALTADVARRRRGSADGDNRADSPPDVPLDHPAVAILLAIAAGTADSLSGRLLSAGDDLAALIQCSEEIQRGELYALRLRT